MKRLFSLFFVAAILTLSVLTLASCNLKQPGKLSEIAGTYVLDEYTVTTVYDKDGKSIPADEQTEKDLIKEYGIVEYYVITESGYGYHVYQDKDTALATTEVKQVYEYDDEDPALIGEITFFDGDAAQDHFYIQSRKHTMTDNTGAWHTDLKVGKKSVPLGEDAEITIRYKRVSKKQDLSYVEKKLDTSLSYTPFLSVWLPDILAGSASKSGNDIPFEDLFIYDYYVVNKTAMTADRYYALTADGEEKTETVSLSYDLSANALKIGETVYTTSANNNAFTFAYTKSEIENDEVVNLRYYLGEASFDASEREAVMASAMETYRISKLKPQE